MSLGKAQREFARDIATLVVWAYENGYELTYGDAYRSPKAFGAMGEPSPYGRSKSAHKQRLAVDFNLFKNGEYLTSTEDHRPLGEKWESIREDNVWGGRFDDGNHYSKKYNGIA